MVGVREGAYSAVINAPNSWVSLETCSYYTEENAFPPLWGLNGNEDETNVPSTVLVCCDETDDRNDSINETGGKPNDDEQYILDEYKPTWFKRDSGYNGQTWEDALIFCENVAGMELCPKDAYCPSGNDVSNPNPLFLNREPFNGEQWAPFLKDGEVNSYVLVGDLNGNPQSACLDYRELHSTSPDWGSGSVELKENIMCCMNRDKFKQEKIVLSTMKPTWMDYESGWKGGSHEDAINFCKSQSKTLCPINAYCPWGPGQPTIGGHSHDLDTEQWAPLFGEDNHWVLVGRKYDNVATTCFTHSDLEGHEPDWGLTSDNFNAKHHILCCSLE